jgi:hypothetical protein
MSGDTQVEVGSEDPTLWEAGEEPRVMGLKYLEDTFCELRLDGLRRSSQNSTSAHSGE